MAFTLPGFELWRFQYVMQGRTVLLEALRDDLCLCAILQPLESVSRQAHRLIEASGDILADHRWNSWSILVTAMSGCAHALLVAVEKI